MLSIGPVATARGSDLVTNLVLSIGPVATARGSDLVTNLVLSIGPVATARGSDLVTNRVLRTGQSLPRDSTGLLNPSGQRHMEIFREIPFFCFQTHLY
jgi:hypothetical protein